MSTVKLNSIKKTYPNGAIAVRGVDMVIGNSEFIVFVGPSGCGKSTMLRMIAGLETITDGEIEIDSKVINNISPADRDVAMVFQNYALYPHMTVRGNMAYGLKNRGIPKAEIDKKVIDAAKMLRIDDYLDRQPNQLSGGQRQRLAIARAILANPKMIILDEATSSLDTESEALIQKSLSELMKERTTIVIAHRLSTIKQADQILVIEAGSIVERGTHAELIAQKGRYYELYTYQAKI